MQGGITGIGNIRGSWIGLSRNGACGDIIVNPLKETGQVGVNHDFGLGYW